jgi:hypothetical protein
MWLAYLFLVICLLGIVKGWEAFNGCIKSSAFVPAMNMLLMTVLFLVQGIIVLYYLSHFNIILYGK